MEDWVLYIKTAARLLYAQHRRSTEIPTMEEWIGKMAEFAEMAKLICLIRNKATSTLRLETFYGLFAENGEK